MVPEVRLELTRPCDRQILNLLRLPIPPFGQFSKKRFLMSTKAGPLLCAHQLLREVSYQIFLIMYSLILN